MGFDQYHEPPEELSQETRTMARMFASMTEEAEAINWYEQRLAIEQDPDARKIIEDARHEEYKHFAMDFEFLLRKRPEWRAIAEGVLFRSGDITENADAAEEGAEVGRGRGRVVGRLAGHRRSEECVMSHLLRAHAPITEDGWQDIDDEARARVTPGLAARRTVDFRGPHGWEQSAVSLGRVGEREAEDGVEIATRLVQPLAEFRAPFSVDVTELRALDRGAEDVDYDDLDRAARSIVVAENATVSTATPRPGSPASPRPPRTTRCRTTGGPRRCRRSSPPASTTSCGPGPGAVPRSC